MLEATVGLFIFVVDKIEINFKVLQKCKSDIKCLCAYLYAYISLFGSNLNNNRGENLMRKR